MPIRYIHNDPASLPYLETVRDARGQRVGQLARFSVSLPAEGVYERTTPEFVDLQCHEAALRTLDAWETVSAPFRLWHNGQRAIALEPRRETGIGASYERTSIGFDYHPFSNPSFFAGASTDAVSHEIGHAILDALRPELWDSFFAEVAAFHEGFSDCVSLLVALLDETVLSALFASASQPADVLTNPNPASQVAESVAKYFKSVHGTLNAAAIPRRLRNDLQWAIPSTLPANPTPTNLSREPHSLGRVFSGCFYDCINNIYRDNGDFTEAGLRDAVTVAGSILAAAVRTAPEEIRFFRAVGRTMIHEDTALFAGTHHLQISNAFKRHNVQLGSSALLAPTTSLSGPAPASRGPASRNLNSRTRNDLVRKAGSGAGARVSTSAVRIGGHSVVRARMRQPVEVGISPFGDSSIQVDAQASEDVLLGGQRGHAVVLGELPNHYATEEEVNSFVTALAENGSLDGADTELPPTHKIQKRGQRNILRRTRFACCHCR